MTDRIKTLPVFCVREEEHPHNIGNVGLNLYNTPVLLLWCRRHKMDSSCSASTLLQAWRDLVRGDRAAMQAHLTSLKKAVLDLETDLEDMPLEQTS